MVYQDKIRTKRASILKIKTIIKDKLILMVFLKSQLIFEPKFSIFYKLQKT
uniref:Uncharacterized protein n=1 Tax=Bartonella schoenbuchensis (strain DSM 13525 / NCTC 13165 / R1) TaxID=687861 RepID=E6Z016_BARSR|nr:hypothetical protein B11C_40309 [Bartonella schoenbuchensis R1]